MPAGFPFVSLGLGVDQGTGTVPVVHGFHFQNQARVVQVQASPSSPQGGRALAQVFESEGSPSEGSPASFPNRTCCCAGSRGHGGAGWEGGLGDLINLISECP